MLICLSLFTFAPACMAQEAEEDPPRSAFGQVMEIMIEALRQEAMRDARSDVLTSDAGTPQKIEVGAAFRPQAAVPEVAVDPTVVDPRCDVQPCEYDSVPNLRIASQK